jgi:hypothetical protein
MIELKSVSNKKIFEKSIKYLLRFQVREETKIL